MSIKLLDSIPTLIALLTVIIFLGGLYVLRRQGNAFVMADYAEMRAKFVALESANGYLLQEMQRQANICKAEIGELKKTTELQIGLLWDSQQEARDWRRQYDELVAEVAGLRSALKKTS